jgi:hypothetical protein
MTNDIRRIDQIGDQAMQLVEKADWDNTQQCYIVQLQCGHTIEISQHYLKSPLLCPQCLSSTFEKPAVTAVVD